MQIPLWLPWALVATVLLPVLLLTWERPRAGAARTAARWSVVAVAIATAAVVTVDGVRVSDDELYDAVERAAQLADGSIGDVTGNRLTALVEERLGHEVSATATSRRDGATARTYSYEIAVVDGGPDPVCVDVSQSLTGADDTLAFTTLIPRRGAC